MVKKFRRYLIRFGATHERDRHTHRERHCMTAYTALMHMHRAVKKMQMYSMSAVGQLYELIMYVTAVIHMAIL